MIIGIAQVDMAWEDIISNMTKFEKLIKEAAENGVELILFPEMALTGFTMNINKLSLSESDIVSWIRKLSLDNNISIGFGYAIKVDEKGKNKYTIVSNEGNTLASYTKIHPFSHGGEDKKYYSGNNISSCVINEFKITPFICYDLRFPEIFQIASKESHIITVAASWPKEREEHWLALLRARAIENQCYIIGINRVGIGGGLEYNGASIFVNPNGEILNELSSEEMLIIRDVNINDIIKSRQEFDIRKDRREAIYQIMNK
ncbi:carbon-nitrogen family hydrolase [Clostridium chromiireducens]|uniref:Carbon-nitrogen family hydrolase n=1 Tax=Clostridium chromiireducens TaxID=225345 RepID=A0A964RJZ4_9CLOT|nr:nitrilase-related carbon-nitrogen hydrolase [Clostridium chromiireducens]MVX62927.1 carbon-nitrogen family hydrolase [Clostridium chromiireducens]